MLTFVTIDGCSSTISALIIMCKKDKYYVPYNYDDPSLPSNIIQSY